MRTRVLLLVLLDFVLEVIEHLLHFVDTVRDLALLFMGHVCVEVFLSLQPVEVVLKLRNFILEFNLNFLLSFELSLVIPSSIIQHLNLMHKNFVLNS